MRLSKSLRIGVIADSFMGWSGGVDFLAYIVNALLTNKDLDVYILFNKSGKSIELAIDNEDQLKELSRKKFKFKTPFQNHSLNISRINDFKKSLNEGAIYKEYGDSAQSFYSVISKNKIDVLLPTMTSLGKKFPTPWIGYIWDFQHKYLPEFFSDDDINHRDNVFLKTLNDAPAVIVNAQTIKKDIIKFYKNKSAVDRIFSLPFSPYPKQEWLEDISNLTQKYNLPSRYFVISNQFWKHKDHLTAIKALAIIKNKYNIHDVSLVATGNMDDQRHPEYISELKKTIKDLGLEKNIILVGYVPKLDQIAIIKQSIFLLQPTLYEGGPGGGSAYNALSLGKKVLLSDIAINKEIDNPLVTFFKAGSPESLAKTMVRILSNSDHDSFQNISYKENKKRLLYSLEIAIRAAIVNKNSHDGSV